MTDEIQKQILLERDPEVLKAKLNLETATATWSDLERFFASGKLIAVDPMLDLIDVAVQIALDSSEQIKEWMVSGKIMNVSDQLAIKWQQDNQSLWTCVVKPFVLVQERND